MCLSLSLFSLCVPVINEYGLFGLKTKLCFIWKKSFIMNLPMVSSKLIHYLYIFHVLLSECPDSIRCSAGQTMNTDTCFCGGSRCSVCQPVCASLSLSLSLSPSLSLSGFCHLFLILAPLPPAPPSSLHHAVTLCG